MGLRYLPIPIRRRRRNQWYRAFDQYNLTAGRPGAKQILPTATDDFWDGNSYPAPAYLGLLNETSGNINIGTLPFTANGTYLYRRTATGLLDANKNWHPTAGIETTSAANYFSGGTSDLEPDDSWLCVAIMRSVNRFGVDRIFNKVNDDGSGLTGNVLFRDGTTIKHRVYYQGDFFDVSISDGVSRDYSFVAGWLDSRTGKIGVNGNASSTNQTHSLGVTDFSNGANAYLFENWDALAGTHYLWIGFWNGADAETILDDWASFRSAFFTHRNVNDLDVEANNQVLVPAQDDGGLTVVSEDDPRLAEKGLSNHSARVFLPADPIFYDHRNADSYQGKNIIVTEQGADGPDGLRSASVLTETKDDIAFRMWKPSLLPGVGRLNPYLKINGHVEAPKFRYTLRRADQCSLDPWDFGEVLERISVSVEPTYNDGSPGFGSNDDSAKFNASDYYKKTSASASQFTTGDIALEVFFLYNSLSSAEYIFSTVASNGLACYVSSNTKIYLYLNDSSGTVQPASSTGLVQGCWYYGMCFVNRDEASTYGSRWYLNNVESGPGVDCSGTAGSLTSSDFTIGAATGGTGNLNAVVAYLAAWEYASWFQAGAAGLAEWDSVQTERFNALFGLYPYQAQGTKTPTTWDRNCAKHIDKYEGSYRKIYQLGAYGVPFVHRKSKTNVDVYGYNAESERENLFPYSEEFTSGWVKFDTGDTLADNQALCPDGRMVAAALIADSDSGAHFIYDSIIPVSATIYAFSVFAKPGNKNWIFLNATTLGDCYFDIANGVVGTANGCVGYIKGPYLHDFYRCCIVFTGDGVLHGMRINIADSDGDNLITDGDGSTVNVYVWGAQIEAGDYMSSYIRTSGASATRLSDDLVFPAGANIGGEDIGKGSISVNALWPDVASVNYKGIIMLSDGGASVDRVGMLANNNTGYDRALSAASGLDAGSSVGSTDLTDGEVHNLLLSWNTDSLSLAIDGVDNGSPDVNCDMPDDLDEMAIGTIENSTLQTDGVLEDLIVRTNSVEGVAPSAYHELRKTVTVAASTKYTVSAVVKSFGTLRDVRVGLVTTSETIDPRYSLDDMYLESGGSEDDGHVISLGDGWYLIQTELTTGVGDAGDADILVGLSDDSNDAYQGDDSTGIYLADVSICTGRMFEVLAQVYGESLTVAKTDYEFNPSEMLSLLQTVTKTVTIWLEITQWPTVAGSYAIGCIYQSSFAGYIDLWLKVTAGPEYAIKVQSDTDYSTSTPTFTAPASGPRGGAGELDANLRLKFTYDADGNIGVSFVGLNSGTEYATISDVITGTDITPTKMILGASHLNSNHLDCHIQKIQVK